MTRLSERQGRMFSRETVEAIPLIILHVWTRCHYLLITKLMTDPRANKTI